MNPEEEFEKRRAGLILVEPGDTEAIREFIILAQAMNDQRDEVGFAAPPRTDEKQVVLVLGQGAFPDPFHRVLEQFLPLNEDELEVLGIGAAGSKDPDSLAVPGPIEGG
ncbi:MAG: hypothetical protein ACYC23_14285 [Limisphaerales bacterium]